MRAGSAPPLLIAVGLLWATSALAHQRSESFSAWTWQEPFLEVTFTVAARETTRLPGGALADHLARTVQVVGGRCEPLAPFAATAARQGYVRARARWRCAERPRVLVLSAFHELAAEHAHFASFASGGEFQQGLLFAGSPRWTLAGPAATQRAGDAGFTGFLGRGLAHILGGLDHLLFVLALWLVCRRPVQLVWALSGFTLGHSIALGLAAARVVRPDVPAIEATIGLTIALVAVERSAVLERSALPLAGATAAGLVLLAVVAASASAGLGSVALLGLALFSFAYLLLAREVGSRGGFRLLITSVFGLVHGLGFAGAFLAMEWPTDAFWLPLAGFNLGVELGQLALVAALLSLGWILRGVAQRAVWTPIAGDLLAACLCGVGVFWLVGRGFA